MKIIGKILIYLSFIIGAILLIMGFVVGWGKDYFSQYVLLGLIVAIVSFCLLFFTGRYLSKNSNHKAQILKRNSDLASVLNVAEHLGHLGLLRAAATHSYLKSTMDLHKLAGTNELLIQAKAAAKSGQ